MSEFKRKDELKIKIKDITCKESSIGNILVEKRQYLLKSYIYKKKAIKCLEKNMSRLENIYIE